MSTEVTHACPPGDEMFMPCCGLTPFDASRQDRITLDLSLVTCGRQNERVTADSTLAAIDAALDGWEHGPDTAGWAPARLPDATRRRMRTARDLSAATGLDGYAALCVAAEAEQMVSGGPWAHWFPARPQVTITVDTARLAAQLGHLGRAVAEAMRPLGAAFKSITEAFAGSGHTVHAAQYPRDHIRCATCHPIASQGPLCIDGREYSRRQRARRRRRC